ncbi:MAG: glycoside hydrolase family 172 protein [Planctomycetota bacterium]
MQKFRIPHFLIALLILIPIGQIAAQKRHFAPGQDFMSLVSEMGDLIWLARLPDRAYRTVQYSSYDRRSVSPEAGEWYSNSDGFGKEPIPGFERVLEEPDEEGVGLYLLVDAGGPGAIVRGWSASMGGVMKVYLDDKEEPIYEGPAYDFLARRSAIFLERAGVNLDLKDAFIQQDADYMPIPFARSLRITWQGKIDELHFYHLEIRFYREGTKVKTFDPVKSIDTGRMAISSAVDRLTRLVSPILGERVELQADIEPDAVWDWSPMEIDEWGAAINELSLKVMAADLPRALRGTLLRIAFDGAHRPQVEAPVGDFFGTGPGVNPFSSLPMSVEADGTMTCRFRMPFQRSAKISLWNSTDEPVRAQLGVRIQPWLWNDRSLYFRAKWRTMNRIDLRFGAFDVPYIVVRGAGRFVGAACMLVNPSGVPHPYGSWWGEGDEKIFVDDEPFPSFYGTGSEDYYNYSWSRPDLFDHPYCGQPLNTGPGNQGYCSNHRWHILDDIPFQRSFAFYMEAWHHSARPGLCYSCIAYHYARPGAIDDHCRVQRSDLVVPEVPPMEPEAIYGAHGAFFHHFEDLDLEVSGGAIGFDRDQTCASRERLVTWKAKAGDRISLKLSIEKEGEISLNMVAAHWPEGGAVRVHLNDAPIKTDDLGGAGLGVRGEEKLVLKSRHGRRLLSTRFQSQQLAAGEHTLTIECVEPGRFGFDYLWIR